MYTSFYHATGFHFQYHNQHSLIPSTKTLPSTELLGSFPEQILHVLVLETGIEFGTGNVLVIRVPTEL